MKYIITKSRQVILFDESIEHKIVAECFGGAKSAAFFQIFDNQIIIGGESLSLGIGPNKSLDELLIKKALKLV